MKFEYGDLYKFIVSLGVALIDPPPEKYAIEKLVFLT